MHVLVSLFVSGQLGCTTMRNSGIGRVLHSVPPNLHIFNTEAFLLGTICRVTALYMQQL